MSDEPTLLSKLTANPQVSVVAAALLTLGGALIGHYVSVLNTNTTASRDIDIKMIEVENVRALEQRKHEHQVTLEDQKFVRDIISKTLEKGTAEEQVRNLKAYAKINLIGSPYRESLLALRDDELPAIEHLERIVGSAEDGSSPEELQALLEASRSVGRLSVKFGTADGVGTGFLVSDRLFLTAGHNLPNAEAAATGSVVFSFGRLDGQDDAQSFALEPDLLFVTNSSLNYTLVALAAISEGNVPLRSYGSISLKPAGENVLAERVSLIHYPLGGPKQVIVRGGTVFARLTERLHYGIYSQPGSAGGPILSANGVAIAMHLAFNPTKYDNANLGKKEGVLMSGIVHDLQETMATLPPAKKDLIAPLVSSF